MIGHPELHRTPKTLGFQVGSSDPQALPVLTDADRIYDVEAGATASQGSSLSGRSVVQASDPACAQGCGLHLGYENSKP